MGLDYSYILFVEKSRLWDTLELVTKLNPDSEEKTDVYCGNNKYTFPFTSNFKTAPVYVHDSVEQLNFDTSLYVPVEDDAMREFVSEKEEYLQKIESYADWTTPHDALGRVSVGYIYLSVDLKSEYYTDGGLPLVRLSFDAATTGMSLLFERSSSVRSVFTQLASQCGAYAVLIDCEGHSIIIWFDGQPVELKVPYSYLPPEGIKHEVGLALAKQVLNNAPQQTAQQLLEFALQNRNAEIRVAALQEYSSNVPVALWAEQAFGDNTEIVKLTALSLISQSQIVDVSEHIIRLLQDASPRIRIAACGALKKTQNDLVWKELQQASHDNNAQVRIAACEALYSIDDGRAVEILLERLKDEDAEVREKAAWYLGRMGDRRAVAPLTARIEDESAGVRMHVAQALGKIGSNDAVEALCRLCSDEAERIAESFTVWRYAFDALGDIKDGRAVGVLLHILSQSGLVANRIVREDAVNAIGKIGDKYAIDALRSLASNKSFESANLATQWLERLEKTLSEAQ